MLKSGQVLGVAICQLFQSRKWVVQTIAMIFRAVSMGEYSNCHALLLVFLNKLHGLAVSDAVIFGGGYSDDESVWVFRVFQKTGSDLSGLFHHICWFVLYASAYDAGQVNEVEVKFPCGKELDD